MTIESHWNVVAASYHICSDTSSHKIGNVEVFDVNHEIIFYGWMFNNVMKKEEHICHPFLKDEFSAVQKYEHIDKKMMKRIYDLLDGGENVVPVEL